LDGGPLDGKSWRELDTDELIVVMSDGQRHRYVRTVRSQRLPDGTLARVFAWAGRFHGPI
jgi:hypothetical protein